MENNIFSLETAGAINPKGLKVDRIALVDADYLKYIFSDRMRKKLIDSKDEIEVFAKTSLFEKISKEVLSDLILKIEDPMIFCFSGKSYNTFRYDVAIEKEYKGNRKKDELYEGQSQDMFSFMQYVIKTYPSLLFEDLEADDIVSALQDEENTYIISKDKDLAQVPGYHYNFINNQIYYISKEDALKSLCYQLVLGDSTDNIPGIEGLGPGKTEAYFKSLSGEVKSYPLNIFNLYLKTYGIFEGLDRFTESVNLIKMRMNRGEWFKSRYIKMFDLKERMLLEIQKRKL